MNVLSCAIGLCKKKDSTERIKRFYLSYMQQKRISTSSIFTPYLMHLCECTCRKAQSITSMPISSSGIFWAFVFFFFFLEKLLLPHGRAGWFIQKPHGGAQNRIVFRLFLIISFYGENTITPTKINCAIIYYPSQPG